MTGNSQRRMLVVSHTARPQAISATVATVNTLLRHGVTPVLTAADCAEFAPYLQPSAAAPAAAEVKVLHEDVTLDDVEIAIVLGGDGTILRAAELVRGSRCPIVGVNLGHVGFLAEMEHHDLEVTLEQVLAREFTVEQRRTLAVEVYDGETLVTETFAVNEATVEKTNRMIEVAIGVDSRPLTGFGCDGVVIATATGSTAYAFSAGGPVMWPGVAATLVVPLAAHALFNRPLVLGPEQVVETRLMPSTQGAATLWCDGRRRFPLEIGQRVVVRQSTEVLRMARLDEGVFTDRLVGKFNLPVTGWREAAK